MKTRFYYSVINGGDGSAYPIFMESKELAEFDQDHQIDGWAENCSGFVEIEHDSPIKLCGVVITIEEYIKDTQESMEYLSNKAYYLAMIESLEIMKGNRNVSKL